MRTSAGFVWRLTVHHIRQSPQEFCMNRVRPVLAALVATTSLVALSACGGHSHSHSHSAPLVAHPHVSAVHHYPPVVVHHAPPVVHHVHHVVVHPAAKPKKKFSFKKH